EPAAQPFFNLERSGMIDRIPIPPNHPEAAEQRIPPAGIDRTRSGQRNILKCAVVRPRYMRAEVTRLDNPTGRDRVLHIQAPGIRKLRTIPVVEVCPANVA